MADTTPIISLNKPETTDLDWGVLINANWDVLDGLFSGTSSLHTHTGENGQGPQISHLSLTDIGTNTHAEIDTHIANSPFHRDTMIGSVSGDWTSPGSPTTVTDVSHMKFTGATVADEGSGVIMVTATASTVEVPTYARAQSASMAYTDNFNWPVGSKLGDYGWKVATPGAGYPEFIVAGPGALTPGIEVLLSLKAASASTAQLGYAVNHVRSHVPHSESQRVTVFIDQFQPASGLLSDVNVNDDFLLSLDLMSDSNGGSAGRPCDFGLSLIIAKPQGATTLAYYLSVKTAPNATGSSEVIYSDFDGVNINGQTTLQALPVNYLTGTHEFSLRRHGTLAGAYYLQYYYQHGLVWRRLFQQSDANGIAQAIGELLTTLSQDATVVNPSYGRIGFSVGYNLSVGKQYIIGARTASIGGQEDLDAIRVVDEPVAFSPVGSPVCGSPFNTQYVGSFFDFDGDGDPIDWAVTSKFFANEEGINQGKGFKVKQTGGSDNYNVFCSPPSSPSLSSTPFINSNQTGSLVLQGRNLPRGPFTTVEFLAGTATIPTNWQAPGGTSVYGSGDVLSDEFIRVVSVDADNGDRTADGDTVIIVNYQTGNRLPWGEIVDIRLTSAYESTFTVTINNALTIRPAKPELLGFTVLAWDEASSPTAPQWVNLRPDAYIFEGAVYAMGVTAKDLPLGDNFWGTGFNQWGLTQNPLIYIPLRVEKASARVYNVFSSQALTGGIGMLSGVPPQTDVTSSSTKFVPTISFDTQCDGESVLIIEKLSPGSWSAIPADDHGAENTHISLVISGQGTTPGQWPDIARRAISANQILPRDPFVTERGITSVVAGTAVTTTVTGTYFDEDSTLAVVSGYGSPSPAVTYLDNGDGTVTLSFVASLGSPGSPDIVVRVDNPEAKTWLTTQSLLGAYNIDGTALVAIGTILTSPAVSPASPAYIGGTLAGDPLVEDQTTIITLDVKDAIYANIDPAQSAYFTITTQEFNPSPNPDGSHTWTVGIFSQDNNATFPSSANLRMQHHTQYVTVPISTSGTESPVLASFNLGGISGGSSWNLNDSKDEDFLYIDVTNGTQNTILEFSTSADASHGLVFVDSGGVKIQGGWELVSGTTWKIKVQKLPDTADGDTVDMSVTVPASDPTLGGVSDTFTTAISFVKNLVVGSNQSGLPTGGVNVVGSGTAQSSIPLGLVPAQATNDIVELTDQERGRSFFLDPVVTGGYTEFVIPGAYIIHSPSSPTKYLTVDFQDELGATIVYPASTVLLTNASVSQIVGSFRCADDALGAVVSIEVTDNFAPSPVGSYQTDTVVQLPQPPRVHNASGSITAAAVGESISVRGTNFVPPTEPAGQPALSYTYELFDSSSPSPAGSPDISNTSFTVTTNNLLTATFDTSANAGGHTVGLRVNYIGANQASFPNLLRVQAVDTSPAPSITGLKFYNSSFDTFVDGGGSPTNPTVGLSETSILRIEGSRLHSLNVVSGYLEIVGEEDDGGFGQVETPPGSGLYPDLKDALSNRIQSQDVITQSDSLLKLEFPATAYLANTRARINLTRPSPHPLGAGTWSPNEMDPSPHSVAGIENFDITVRHGTTVAGPQMNHDTGASAITQLSWARDAQALVGPGTEGDTIDVVVRFASAIVSNPPQIISVADPDYGTEFTVNYANVSANLFEMTLNLTIPSPGVGNTYVGISPAAGFDSPSPSGSPIYASAGLRMANGQALFSTVLGRTDWFDYYGQVSPSP